MRSTLQPDTYRADAFVMGMAGTSGRSRRRAMVGLFAALGLGITGAVGIVATTPDSSSASPAQLVRSVSRLPEALPKAAIPSTDAAVAAAAWGVAHPPPPPPLPIPSELPDPSSPRALVEIGRIQIPKTGVDQAVREGVEQVVIDAGPAHWPGTAEFGGWGNVVLAGHRTTHSEPFLRNAELAVGDEILVSDSTGTYHYAVTSVEVLPNTAMWIVDQHEGRSLTIFTCHPIGSSAERLVVRAELKTRARES